MPTSRKAVRRPRRYLGVQPRLDETSPFIPSAESGLDAADLKIIQILWEDGRANNRSMVEPVGLTEETVAARIRSMVERKIIGITTVFDWRAAGYEVNLWLRIECDGDLRHVAETLVALDEIVRVWTVLGSVDLIAEALLPDMEAAVEFLSSPLRRVGGVRRVDVSLALDTIKSLYQFTNIPVRFQRVRLPNPVAQLDELDWSIVQLLAENGRDSNREIARRLGVSDGAIRTRIGRLEESGLLRVCAQVDPRRSGMLMEQSFAFLSVHGRDVRDVARDLADIPEVAAVTLVMGREAILTYVAASSRDRVVRAVTGPIRSTPGVKALDLYDITEHHKPNVHWARWWTSGSSRGSEAQSTTSR